MAVKRTEAQRRADARYDARRAGRRTRNFATVVYPESAPSDWVERLHGHHIAALISPLHDRDLNPDGDVKKPHYHVMMMFDSPKDFETQVKPIIEEIGGVGREKISSVRGYARYLCHLDNPEKAQYAATDVQALGGADYAALTHLATDDIGMLKDIFAFVTANRIYSLAHLLDICVADESKSEWFTAICTNKAYIVKEFMQSLLWEYDNSYDRDRSSKSDDSLTKAKAKSKGFSLFGRK